MDDGKLRICFVSDEVIGNHIKSYRVKEICSHSRVKERGKENHTKSPSRAPKMTEASGHVPRKKKTAVQVSSMTPKENASTKAESIRNEEDTEEEGDSTDVEIQLAPTANRKLPTKAKNLNTGNTKEKKRVNEKLSNLKEMTEEYFAVHHQKKIVTSDRVLSNMQNPRISKKDLEHHLANTTGSHSKECIRLYRQYAALFPKWIFQLRHGFNILLHGLGSKRKLLEEFRMKMLPDLVHIVINGFFPSLTIKSILNMISDDVLKCNTTFKNIIDHCNFIKCHYNTDDADELFLIIHNMDGQMLRNSKVQDALSYLASTPRIHIIASIDHINASIVWDQSRSSRFNWLWFDVTTYQRYTEEVSFENSLFAQQTGSLALSSLTHVLRSLTPNARGIFKVLAEYLLNGGDGCDGMSFGELYQKCREKFLVNSDLTLRAQLIEFKDHKLIKFRKGADGAEILSIPLHSSNLKLFIEENNL